MNVEGLNDITFAQAHLGNGYDMGEVDQFVADVEKLFDQREREIRDLRERLAGAVEASATGDRQNGVDRVPEASSAAARLLEVATRSAEELVAEARADADSLVAEATTTAEAVRADARAEAERVGAELAEHEREQLAELARHRNEVLTEVASTKAATEAEIERLRQLECEQREHMQRYLTEQLALVQDVELPSEVASPLFAVAD
jgi:DivIVA domain-containing protein